MTQDLVVGVSDLVTRINTLFKSSMNLNNVWIQGEVSNLTKHRSGHYYFSLKDENSEIACVMFSTNVHKLTFSLEQGMRVLVQGSVHVYETRGSLQLYIKTMKQDGIGDLFLEFEQRKKRLYQQGYFQDSHKKEKPDWIENIGIITAKEGAALQDVLKTIRTRWPAMKMTLYPCYVQGNMAAQTMIRALLKADTKGHDALLLVRGGGSFEDLFCFNDEELVKTIYNLNTYIVTGVGHEVDTTLVDLVSDHASLTPTAAGQWVSVDFRNYLEKISSIQNSLIQSMNYKLQQNKHQLNSVIQHPYFVDPKSYIFEKTLKLDGYVNVLENVSYFVEKNQNRLNTLNNELENNVNRLFQVYTNEYKKLDLETNFKNYFNDQQQSFSKSVTLLDAYSPLKTIVRGYSITTKENKIVRSIQDIEVNDTLKIRVSDGLITSTVSQKEKNNA